MKFTLSIFFAFVLCCFITTNAHTEKHSEFLVYKSGNQASTSEHYLPVSFLKNVDFPPANKIKIEKQVKQRGVIALFIHVCVSDFLIVRFFDNYYYNNNQLFKLLTLFFINEKRGPPVI